MATLPAYQHADNAKLRIKFADTDKEFEQSLADLAYTQLSSRSPRLFRYVVAFQLIDQSDDRTRATGVFVFNTGDYWFQVPVFYRDGEIRGSEILMLGEDDYFPLTEESVNFFLEARATASAGKGIDKSETNRQVAPSLWQLNTPPTKWAMNALPQEAYGLDSLARAVAGRLQPLPKLPTVEDAVAVSPKIAYALDGLISRYPLLAEKLKECVDVTKLAAAIKKVRMHRPSLRARLRRRNIIPFRGPKTKVANVMVIRVTQTRLTATPMLKGMSLSKQNRDELKAGRNVYEDKRKDGESTFVVDWGMCDGSPGVAHNPPSHPVVANVIVQGGKKDKCLVVSAPVAQRGPKTDYVLVLRLSDGSHCIAPRADVWMTASDPEAFNEWRDKLPKAKEGKELPERFVLVAPNGQVSSVFSNYGDARGLSGTSVNDCGCDTEPPGWFGNNEGQYQAGAPPWDYFGNAGNSSKSVMSDSHLEISAKKRESRVDFTPVKTRDFITTDNCLYFPAETKVYSIPYGASSHLPLASWNRGGLIEDVLSVKRAAEGAKLLSVDRTGDRVRIKVAGHEQVYTDVRDAEADLVEWVGLKLADAQRLLGYAAKQSHVEVGVKFADAYTPDLQKNLPEAPGFPIDFGTQMSGLADDVVPTGFQGSVALGVPSTYPTQADWDRYRVWPPDNGMESEPITGSKFPAGPEQDPKLLKHLMSAAESGQKSLVNVSALAALIDQTDEQNILAELLGPLRKVISLMGQTLCHGYANEDNWRDRYGRVEASRIIDQIRGQFASLGELYLTLREKASDQVLTDTSILPDAPRDA